MVFFLHKKFISSELITFTTTSLFTKSSASMFITTGKVTSVTSLVFSFLPFSSLLPIHQTSRCLKSGPSQPSDLENSYLLFNSKSRKFSQSTFLRSSSIFDTDLQFFLIPSIFLLFLIPRQMHNFKVLWTKMTLIQDNSRSV